MFKRYFLRRSMLALAAALLATSAAQAFCLPPTHNGMPQIAASQNAKGCWAGWWCSRERSYVIAATKQQCNLVGNKRAVAEWVMSPDPQRLPTGTDMLKHPTLKAIWVPERAKLDALRPKPTASTSRSDFDAAFASLQAGLVDQLALLEQAGDSLARARAQLNAD